jgi:nucleoside-diphosphate-sugar epimerase
MQANEPIDMTECIQNWDYIYVEDVVDALVKFLDVDCECGAFNLASGNSRQLKEFVEEIKSILQSKSVINYGVVPYGNEGPVSFEPNVSKLEKALSWKAETTFKEGIIKLVKSFNL